VATRWKTVRVRSAIRPSHFRRSTVTGSFPCCKSEQGRCLPWGACALLGPSKLALVSSLHAELDSRIGMSGVVTGVFSATELTMTRDSRNADGFGSMGFENGKSQQSETASGGTGLSRRRFVGAAAVAASQVGLWGLHGRLDAMTEKTVTAGGQSDSE